MQDRTTVSILRMIKDTYQTPNLFPIAVDILDMCLFVIGLSALTADLKSSSPAPLGAERSLAFKFVKLIKSKSKSVLHKYMRIREDPIIWQLRLFGEYMDRSMDSEYDPRVPFKPDAWQRKVLDCLDDPKHSVLVVGAWSYCLLDRVETHNRVQRPRVLERLSFPITLWSKCCGSLTTDSSYTLLRRRPS